MKEELFANFKELQSDRLLLRQITSQDSEALFEIYSNKEVMLYFDDRGAFESLSEAEDMAKGYENGIKNRAEIRWGIVLKETGKLIGTCGFAYNYFGLKIIKCWRICHEKGNPDNR